MNPKAIALASILAVAAMAVASLPASAGYKTGNDLFTDCTSPQGSIGWSICLGYLQGFVDAISEPDLAISGKSIPTCVQQGVTETQLMAITVNFLQAHPEILHWPAIFLVWNALNGAYHCALATSR